MPLKDATHCGICCSNCPALDTCMCLEQEIAFVPSLIRHADHFVDIVEAQVIMQALADDGVRRKIYIHCDLGLDAVPACPGHHIVGPEGKANLQGTGASLSCLPIRQESGPCSGQSR